MDLAEFLLARIAEDEEVARAAAPGPWSYGDVESIAGGTIYDPTVAIANVDWDPEPVDQHIRRTRPEYEADATGRHIARHDPQRVLAECAAEREVVAEHATQDVPVLVVHGKTIMSGPECRVCVNWEEVDMDGPPPVTAPCRTLRLLAQPFADHPDFRPEWALVKV